MHATLSSIIQYLDRLALQNNELYSTVYFLDVCVHIFCFELVDHNETSLTVLV